MASRETVQQTGGVGDVVMVQLTVNPALVSQDVLLSGFGGDQFAHKEVVVLAIRVIPCSITRSHRHTIFRVSSESLNYYTVRNISYNKYVNVYPIIWFTIVPVNIVVKGCSIRPGPGSVPSTSKP